MEEAKAPRVPSSSRRGGARWRQSQGRASSPRKGDLAGRAQRGISPGLEAKGGRTSGDEEEEILSSMSEAGDRLPRRVAWKTPVAAAADRPPEADPSAPGRGNRGKQKKKRRAGYR